MGAFKYAIGKPWLANGTAANSGEGDFIIPSGVTTGGNLVTGYDGSEVRHEHLRRGVRFTTGGARTITFQGVSQKPDAILIEDLTTTSITITTSGGGSQGPLTVAQNPRTGRYSILVEPTPVSATDWTVQLNNNVIAGYGYLGCGRITMVKATSGSVGLKSMVVPWGEPYRVNTHTMGADRMLAGGYVETTSTSDVYCTFDIQNSFPLLTAATIAHPLAFVRMKTDQRVLIFEGRDDDTSKVHGYLCRRSGDPQVIQDFPSLDVGIQLTEVL